MRASIGPENLFSFYIHVYIFNANTFELEEPFCKPIVSDLPKYLKFKSKATEAISETTTSSFFRHEWGSPDL